MSATNQAVFWIGWGAGVVGSAVGYALYTLRPPRRRPPSQESPNT